MTSELNAAAAEIAAKEAMTITDEKLREAVSTLALVGHSHFGYYEKHGEFAQQTIEAALTELIALRAALIALGPFEIVQGDCIHRTSPGSRQVLNTNTSWLVSAGDKSAHRLLALASAFPQPPKEAT